MKKPKKSKKMDAEFYINGKKLEGIIDFSYKSFEEQREIMAVKVYESAFIYFGLLPTLLLLDECEENENYFECYCLKKAMDNVNKNHGTNYATRLSLTAYQQTKDCFATEELFKDHIKKLPKTFIQICKYVDERR